jgi:hypothetical protein
MGNLPPTGLLRKRSRSNTQGRQRNRQQQTTNNHDDLQNDGIRTIDYSYLTFFVACFVERHHPTKSLPYQQHGSHELKAVFDSDVVGILS